MNIELSNMKLSDLSVIAGFDCFWDINNLKSELLNPNSTCIVARRNSESVGFACVWESVDDMHITNIVVKPDCKHQGIGSILLERIIDITKSKNKQSLTLEVNVKNVYAQELYLKYNFKKLGIRKKYYNVQDDAVIMTLYLGGTDEKK